MPKALFVCTANMCRSPMAERLFNAMAKSLGLPWTASSAGTAATPGMPVSEGTAGFLTERGIDYASHRSRPITPAIAREADVIYALTREHRDRIIARIPEAASKTVVLREAAGLDEIDVVDPIFTNDYEACAQSIEEALEILLRRQPNAQNTR